MLKNARDVTVASETASCEEGVVLAYYDAVAMCPASQPVDSTHVLEIVDGGCRLQRGCKELAGVEQVPRCFHWLLGLADCLAGWLTAMQLCVSVHHDR